jgi:hypothetical protein
MSAFDAYASDDFTNELPKGLQIDDEDLVVDSDGHWTSGHLLEEQALPEGSFDDDVEDLLHWKSCRQLGMRWHLLRPEKAYPGSGLSRLADEEERVQIILLRMVSFPDYRARLLALEDEEAVDVLEVMQSVRTRFS